MLILSRPRFSVIIPAYNVEPYLTACVDSILSQNYGDFEVILVDDGSTDGCPALCDSFAANDGRVRVIHKTNGGLSDARNAGIKAAAGEYLLFVDGDDYLTGGALSRLAHAVDCGGAPDAVFLNAEMFYPDGAVKPYGTITSAQLRNKSHEQILRFLASGGQFHVSACLKAVKRQLIVDNNLFFQHGIVGEDVDYSIGLYLCARTYGCCGGISYRYRQGRAGQITARRDDKRFADLLGIVGKWAALAQEGAAEQRVRIRRFLYHQYFVLVALYATADRRLKTKDNISSIKRLSYLLKYPDKAYKKSYYIVLKLCGITVASRLFRLSAGALN